MKSALRNTVWTLALTGCAFLFTSSGAHAAFSAYYTIQPNAAGDSVVHTLSWVALDTQYAGAVYDDPLTPLVNEGSRDKINRNTPFGNGGSELDDVNNMFGGGYAYDNTANGGNANTEIQYRNQLAPNDAGAIGYSNPLDGTLGIPSPPTSTPKWDDVGDFTDAGNLAYGVGVQGVTGFRAPKADGSGGADSFIGIYIDEDGGLLSTADDIGPILGGFADGNPSSAPQQGYIQIVVPSPGGNAAAEFGIVDAGDVSRWNVGVFTNNPAIEVTVTTDPNYIPKLAVPGDFDDDLNVDNADLGIASGGFSTAAAPGEFLGRYYRDGNVDDDYDVDNADLGAVIGAFAPGTVGLTTANLIYDPALGTLTMSAAEAAGGVITSFQLENISGAFIAGNYVSLSGGTFGTLYEDASAHVLGDTDTGLTGFSGPVSLGAVLPVGLDLAGLQALLSAAVYTGAAGSGQQSFDLIVAQGAPTITFFDADFDGTPVADLSTNNYGAQITEANLNAGTAIGTWTVNQAQGVPGTSKTSKRIQTDGGENVTEKALRFGISTDGTMGVNNAVVTANLTSALSASAPIKVSFDYGIISTDSGTRTTYMTGLDGSGNRLFQVGFVNSGTVKQMGYFNSSGTWTLIGSVGDLIGNNNTFWKASLMKNVTIEIGTGTYDIKLAGTTLAGGNAIPFRDASASGLSQLAFSASTKWTGGAFDNMLVTQEILPDPDTSTVVAAPPSAPADGATTSTITVTLKTTDGTPLPDQQVTLDIISGPGVADILTPQPVTTDAGGVAQFIVSSTTPGIETFRATSITGPPIVINNTADVEFTATTDIVSQTSLIPGWSPLAAPDPGTPQTSLAASVAPLSQSYAAAGVSEDGAAGETKSPVDTATAQIIRITEYYVTTGDFISTTTTLTLDQDLASDYFILVRGSRIGDGLSFPDNDYARVVAVPGGRGGLTDSGAPDAIRLQRAAADADWEGVVTVVECTAPDSPAGFRLLDALVTDLSGPSGTSPCAPWTDFSRVVPFGGYRGGGIALTGDVSSRYQGTGAYVRLFLAGGATLNWERDGGGETLPDATMTTFVVEWGSDWVVQHASVAGSSGGNGADETGEYTTAAITPVARANTWVWGTGVRADAGIGDCAESCLVTLGDGVNQNDTESTVAVGSEYPDAYSFDVYTLTHPGLAVDQRFKADGDRSALDLPVTVNAAPTGARFAWAYNGCDGTSSRFPRPRFWSRYTADGTVTISRGYDGASFPAWIQGVDFSGLNAE